MGVDPKRGSGPASDARIRQRAERPSCYPPSPYSLPMRSSIGTLGIGRRRLRTVSGSTLPMSRPRPRVRPWSRIQPICPSSREPIWSGPGRRCGPSLRMNWAQRCVGTSWPSTTTGFASPTANHSTRATGCPLGGGSSFPRPLVSLPKLEHHRQSRLLHQLRPSRQQRSTRLHRPPPLHRGRLVRHRPPSCRSAGVWWVQGWCGFSTDSGASNSAIGPKAAISGCPTGRGAGSSSGCGSVRAGASPTKWTLLSDGPQSHWSSPGGRSPRDRLTPRLRNGRKPRFTFSG